MASHAKLSPSQAKRWMNCPGSVALVAALPGGARRGSNKYSREGTAAHALLSHCLMKAEEGGYEACHPLSYVDKYKAVVLPDDLGGDGMIYRADDDKCLKAEVLARCDTFPVDKEMAEAVQVAYEAVLDLKKQYPHGRVRFDQKSNLDAYGEDLGGHSDIVFDAWPDLLVVLDYKHGAGVTVEVEQNEQCRSYILGEAHVDGFSHGLYQTGIVQPRKPHPDGFVRTETLTPDELKAWGEELRAARLRVDDENAPLEVGDWCRWCDASGRCPKQREVAETVAASDFADAPPPGGLLVPETIEDMANLLKWEGPIKALLKSARARITEAAMRGDPVPGYKLIIGKQGNRAWVGTPEEIAIELAKKTGSEPHDYFEKPELLSPASVEKLGAAHKKALKDISDTRIYRSPGKPTLVLESKPGKAIAAADLSAFPAYTEDEDGDDE